MNLNNQLVKEIIDISKNHTEITKVVLFGSRARKDNYEKSDIDLAIYSTGDISEFIEDIETKTSTLLEFDYSDMKNIYDDFFIEQVNKEGITIYEKY